jgi:hypothetical protein
LRQLEADIFSLLQVGTEVQVSSTPDKAMAPPNERTASGRLFRAIATDLHFWIPLIVLVGGFLLLDRLR